MIGKSFFTIFGDRISCVGFSADKSFVYFDIAIFLEANQVRGQVAVRHFQHLFQVIEADFIIDHQDAHYTEPNPVIKYFIQACYRIFQR